MTVSEKQQALVRRFAVIPDPQERLAALIASKPVVPLLPGPDCVEANRVHGCISRVWLAGTFENGVCHFRFEADSPMVRGLVAALCGIYHGAAPEDVIATEPRFFEELGIARNLTPTRQNGLAAVRRTIVEFARNCPPSP